MRDGVPVEYPRPDGSIAGDHVRVTGFDVPCLHTMYGEKPMQGHGQMQAISRVNRVSRDKPGGLVVDSLGVADQLKRALASYIESGGKGNPTFNRAPAIAVMHEKHGIVCKGCPNG